MQTTCARCTAPVENVSGIFWSATAIGQRTAYCHGGGQQHTISAPVVRRTA